MNDDEAKEPSEWPEGEISFEITLKQPFSDLDPETSLEGPQRCYLQQVMLAMKNQNSLFLCGREWIVTSIEVDVLNVKNWAQIELQAMSAHGARSALQLNIPKSAILRDENGAFFWV